MPAGEVLLTNVDHDNVFTPAGSDIPSEWDEDLVNELRDAGAVGYPEVTSPEELGAQMTDIDAALQDEYGVTLSELLAKHVASQEAEAEAEAAAEEAQPEDEQ